MDIKSNRKIFNYYLIPDVQLSFALFLGFSIFFIGVVYIALFYQLNSNYYDTIKPFITSPSDIEALLQERLSRIIVFTLGFLFIFSFVTFLMAIRLSHRIVGPIVQLEKNMKETIKTGVVQEIHFRPQDFFQSLSETFNKYTKVLTKNDLEK